MSAHHSGYEAPIGTPPIHDVEHLLGNIPALDDLRASEASETQVGATRLTSAEILGVRRAESRRIPEAVLADGARTIDRLLRLGWHLEAAGDDGLIFGREASPLVLRLAQNWEAYGRFVELARELGSPHLPRFFRWETQGRLSLAVVERLAPIARDSLSWPEINRAAAIAHGRADGRPDGLEVETASPILKAAAMLGDLAHEYYYALDMGIENILLRSATGEPVFNDPWSAWGE